MCRFSLPFPLNTNDSPAYEFKYFLSVYVCFAAHGGYVGVDGLFVGFSLHLSSHYKIISKRISELRGICEERESPSKYSPRENERIQKQVQEIIESHVEVMELTKKVSRIFSMICFVHFLAASIVIGMTSINFLLANWSAKVLYINYMAGSFLHAYLYSATGQYLSDSVGDKKTFMEGNF